MSQLRPYQEKLKQDTYKEWQTHRNVLMVLPTGGGKTFTFTSIGADFKAPVVAIAHRQELVGQMSVALGTFGIKHRIIGPQNVIRDIIKLHIFTFGEDFYDPASPVAVAGVDTLINRKEQLSNWCPTVQLWITDECFPAGTLIGGTPIEEIKVGDQVTSFNETTGLFEKRRVNRLYKNKAPKEMVRISIRHHVLYCTKNHPIWTNKGWVNAEKLTRKHKVYVVQDQRRGYVKAQEETIRDYRPSLLWQRLCKRIPIKDIFGNNAKDKLEICIEKNERKQPYAKSRSEGKDECHFKTDGALPKGARGERSPSDRCRSEVARTVQSSWFQFTNYCQDWTSTWGKRLPKSLQNRLWSLGLYVRNRGRRNKSLFFGEAGSRPEERPVFEWVGVDNITIQERDNFTGTRGSCSNGYVYNFEVDGLHTYTAEGIVVHNCHHLLKDNKWGKAVAMFPNARGLGVTATPVRADGKGLGAHADGVFQAMVEGPSMRSLIDDGFLTDYRIFAPPSDMDLSEVTISKTTGDYTRTKMIQAAEKSHITGDVVEHYLKLAKGKLGITFAPDIAMATSIAEQFNAAGVPAAVVSSKTPALERAKTLRRFKNRELLQLTNVDLFGEGFDLPAIEVLSMARPTASFGLFVQMFGRPLRLLKGKTHGIIIDHVGNTIRHGLPDAVREWSLDRREKRSSGTPDDSIPVRACPDCTMVYERTYVECPFCGYKPVPAERSTPAMVDGDLVELDAATLAQLRGAVEEVDMPDEEYRLTLAQKRIPPIGQMAQMKRHRLRKEAQHELRDTMALWGGHKLAEGKSMQESQKLFYFKFGIDVMSAQVLGDKDATVLNEKLIKEIG